MRLTHLEFDCSDEKAVVLLRASRLFDEGKELAPVARGERIHVDGVRPIDANSLAIVVALYMAENAYLNDTALDALKKVAKWLDEEPTLDYAPVRHGEWIDEIEPNAVTASGREVHVFECSACGFTWSNKYAVLHYFKHCPNCGAKMDGGVSDG